MKSLNVLPGVTIEYITHDGSQSGHGDSSYACVVQVQLSPWTLQSGHAKLSTISLRCLDRLSSANDCAYEGH